MTKKSIIKARALLGLMLLFGAAFFSAGVSSRGNDETLIEFVALLGAPNYSVEKHSDAIEMRNTYLSNYTSELQNQPLFVPVSEEYATQLSDFNYLTRNIFLVDPRTKLLETDIDAAEFLAKDFTIDTSEGPQVLIIHAHSMEMFADSDPSDPFTGVFGVGRRLAEILEQQHSLEVLHHTERFDVVNGIPNRQGSYERLEPAVRRILADNPSIQVVIDLHRDGVGAHVAPMVTYIEGERAAQIMFVNGLSRRYRSGVITPVNYLPNPYQRENLAFSMNLQLAANQMYPGLARRVYLLEFRYSLHMAPRSILLEVGAQNNTFQEALNAVPAIANIIAAVVLGE
ncbi:MAG: stage II sporulation protein P [Defluviitaleaceae bacterium]|nr:stage II sporulation protein P [Defluviitaleaceae bacterium]